MIDAKKLTKQLTIDNYRQIALALGATIDHENDKEILFSNICHEKNPDGLKNKLYFYKDRKFFLCYHCSVSYTPYSLVQKRKRVLGETCSFPDALKFVCDVCHIPYDNIERIHKQTTKIYDWEEDLGRYIRIKNGESLLPIYDKNILDFFPKIYHQSFIDDGISIHTMEMFEICFYPYAQQIVIPVFDENGNLIGLHGRNLIPELIEAGYKYLPVKLVNGVDEKGNHGTEFRFNTSNVLYGLNLTKSNIEYTGEVTLFEAPKSVMQMNDILFLNNTVGMFGMNLQNKRRDMLLKLGVNKVNIALDKQYETIYDEDGEFTEKFILWKKKVLAIADKFKGFAEVNVIYDADDDFPLLDYKDSPSDKGEEIWDLLYKNKECIDERESEKFKRYCKDKERSN